MSKRACFLAVPLLLLSIALGGCLRDYGPADTPGPTSPEPTATAVAPGPTATAATAVAPGPTATAAPTQAPAAVPTATPGLNGSNGFTHDVSLVNRPQQLTTVEVAKLLKPSVVQISTETVTFGFFNQPIPNRGVGTGVILDDQGHILTNHHVIAGAQSISVTLHSGETYSASVVGDDVNTDLAVIRVQAEGLQPARLGDSSVLQVGEDVIAIGYAMGLQGDPTVSKGVVSALGRSIDTDVTTIVDLIQTDASINPGNSGGPLVNTSGEVIGINTAIIQSGQGIGFAININDAKAVAAQLVENGFVRRGYMGVGPATVTPAIARQFDLAVTQGILIVRVTPRTPAFQAGLRPGDVIVEMGGQPINNTGELSKFLMAHAPGETVDVVYYRGSTRVTTRLTLGERPPE